MGGRKRKVDISRLANLRKADAARIANSQNATSDDSSEQDVAPLTKGTTTRGKPGKAAATSTQSQAAGGEPSNITKPSDTSPNEEPVYTETLNEPRAKRQKISPSTEIPMATRSSARLRARAKTPAPELPPKLSPQSSSEPAEASDNTVKDTTFEQNEANPHAPEQTPTDSGSRLTPKSSDAETASMSNEQATLPRTRGRKRKLKEDNTDTSTNVAKKVKVEEEESEATTTAAQTGAASSSEEVANTQDPEINQPVNESVETNHTENVDHAGSGQNGTASGSGTRGRGKGGRGKGKGKGKGSGNNGKKAGGGGPGRGKGKGGGKGGKQNDDDSEVEPERPLPPNPYAQKLAERQKELKQNYKRLAAAQKLLLSELAGRTQQTLARNKNAHLEAPEFEEVQAQLELALQKRLEILEHEHRLRVHQANIIMEAETQIIRDRFEANASNIQDELFYAARGEYMRLVEGVQHADDDEHTEPDLDGPGLDPSKVATAEEQPTTSIYEHEPYYLNEPRFKRGYNSRFIREISGAEAYERGKHGWDDFLQRAKLNEISQEESAADSLELLLQASREAFADEVGPSSSTGTASSEALFALADAASTAQPVSPLRTTSFPIASQTTSDQQHLPSFMLPQPQTQPLARPTLPPSRGFPDVFTMGTRVPQLPPLPGGPLPRYRSSQHQNSQIQYHPVPPPAPLARAPAAPPPYYYQNNSHPHSHQLGPAPPSQPPSATPRRPY